MFNILNHQGNAIQNNHEFQTHNSQNGKVRKLRGQQMLDMMWRKRNTPPLLVGLQTGKTTLKINLVKPQKIGYSTT